MTEPAATGVASLPHALDDDAVLAGAIGKRTPAVFLDYDGTLTPIVNDPSAAVMSDDARRAVRRLAALCPVAIVSGRDRADVSTLVGIDGLVCAGSHGFDIAGPGWSHRHPGGAAAQDALARAADALDQSIGTVPGVIVERKQFAVAIHFRMVEGSEVPHIDAAVDRALAAEPGLRRTTGKMIFELRPDLEWDKGRALLFLLGQMGLDQPDVLPIYVGDDDTDEDAFRAIGANGLGVIVGTEDRETAAHLRVDDPAQAVALLDRVSDLVEERLHHDD